MWPTPVIWVRPSGRCRLAVPYVNPGHWSWLEVGGSVLVVVGVCLVVLWLGRRWPYLLVGWCWYLGTLMPVIGLTKGWGTFMADRFTYLPQLGLYLMVAWGAVDGAGVWRGRRVVLASAAVVIVTSLLVAARVQTRYWRDSISLWTHTLACTPENFFAHHKLGVALAAQGKWNEAISHYERVLQLKPDAADVHNNFGIALAAQGKWNEAIAHYERALRLNPDDANTHNSLGVALAQEGKLDEAIGHLERALQLKPDNAEVHNNSGLMLVKQRKWAAAIAHYERALQLKPDYAEAQNNVGFALVAQGKLAEAMAHYERVLQLKPDYAEAHSALGVALARRGNLNEAIRHLERALQLDPDSAQAENNLGVVLATEGKLGEAIGHYERALQRKPDYAEAKNGLGSVLAQQGKLDEAIARFERALQFEPDSAQVHDNLGIALARQGKLDAAREHFQQGLNLATAQNNPGLAEALRTQIKSYPSPSPQPEKGLERQRALESGEAIGLRWNRSMTQRGTGKPGGASGPPPGAGASAGRTDPGGQTGVGAPPGWVIVLAGLLLALAVWAVFGQTRHHDFVNLNDDSLHHLELARAGRFELGGGEMGVWTVWGGLLAPADLAFVDVGREPLWPGSRWVSLHECGVARRQQRVALPVAPVVDGGVVAERGRGGAVCPASAAGGVGGLGDGTQGCAQRLLRPAVTDILRPLRAMQNAEASDI